MPKRTDLNSILILGAGPIIIGQACEFDYSGTQACKALREEGFRIILVNSNPATIMTDPEMADATYIEPIQWQTVAQIIKHERPDAILPTMGGQTALNCALALHHKGILDKYKVDLIGASVEAINKAENRQLFRDAMQAINLSTPQSIIVHDMEQAWQAQKTIAYPCIIRPSFTLGGTGGGIAYDNESFTQICEHGLLVSPNSEILIEQSLLGWKEFEMEVIRDRRDNCIIVCCIENFDPMGVHTGDSITVAPAQTLTDKEYQIMRNASIKVLCEIGVETGGSNVQFAVNPKNGELMVIEMNPRVSRSSALASKATGFPIARVAAKLAVGYTLDELDNEITGNAIAASFEPVIDYVVTKIPRFTFEKFPQADDRLTTQMKSVGEVMAIGRTFQESLQKALRSLETGLDGLNPPKQTDNIDPLQRARQEMCTPRGGRVLFIADAFRHGMDIDEIHQHSQIDPWFLIQIEDLIYEEKKLSQQAITQLDMDSLFMLKRKGFSDLRIADLMQVEEQVVRDLRHQYNLRPVFKRVDSCAAEFATTTAYMYSTYEEECEAQPSQRKKIMVLGGGPNRIGQGIEFDYCCVQAVLAIREVGYETIMVNCNPETISTDYDISDRLYFEPLTVEDVLEVIHVEKPYGVIIQYGGQTPLQLGAALEAAGVNILGTAIDSIDLAEDRERFQQLLSNVGLKQPVNYIAKNMQHALELSKQVSYPVVVRPSYVLGGRAMEIIYSQLEMQNYIKNIDPRLSGSAFLLDGFLRDAIEVDVDVVCDGNQAIVCGVMQHIEQAGIHSGDSACCLPPHSLSTDIQAKIKQQACVLAKQLHINGLMNVQFAIQKNAIYVLEANPRASRTVPFVAKSTGIAWAKIATYCMLGQSLIEQDIVDNIETQIDFFCIKESVFPFAKLPQVDPLLGPEMKSTGEVMGIGKSFGEAFAKAQAAVGEVLPVSGLAFISVRNSDKNAAVDVCRALQQLGFRLCATQGTAKVLQQANLACEVVKKVREGTPHIIDLLQANKVDLIVNTTEGKQAILDSYLIRRTALQNQVFYTTTIAGAMATTEALQAVDKQAIYCLQDLHNKNFQIQELL